MLIGLVFGITRNSGEITINLERCIDGRTFSKGKIVLRHEGGKKIKFQVNEEERTIKKLKSGNYEIEFLSLFGRKEVEKIYLKNREKKEITICIDKFTSDIEPILGSAIIDSISVNEEFQINFKSLGCFHAHQDSLEIKRNEKGYFFRCDGTWAELNEKGLNLIREFELKLINGRLFGMCITSDYYEITYNNRKSRTIFDGTCSWYGFDIYKNEIKKITCQ